MSDSTNIMKQHAKKIINIEHVNTVILDNNEESMSSDDKLTGLIVAAYNCTVDYRKLLNSNESSEEKEMAVLNRLHSSIQDVYFFYEQNQDHNRSATALSIVSAYNKFLAQFKQFVELRNTGKDADVEAVKTSRCFDALVHILLEAQKES